MSTLLKNLIEESNTEQRNELMSRRNRQEEMKYIVVKIAEHLQELGFTDAAACLDPKPTGRRSVTFSIGHPDFDKFYVGVWETGAWGVLGPRSESRDWEMVPPALPNLKPVITKLIKNHLSNSYNLRRVNEYAAKRSK
jgi:hypothetical protein